jgi:tetratricopeptide (TPR) repeat protein
MKAIKDFFQKPIAKLVALIAAVIIIAALAWRPLQVLNLQARAGSRIDAYIETNADPASHFLACQMPLLIDLPEDEGLAEAVDLLEKARDYEPFQAQTAYLLGRAYCLEGEYTKAIEALNDFVQARPENPKGALEAAYAHLSLAERDGGLSEAERGLHQDRAIQLLTEAGYGFDYFLSQGQRAFEDESYPTAWLLYRTAALFEPLPANAAIQFKLLSEARVP